MNFLKNILGEKDKPIMTYSDFWIWFQKNGNTFFNAVKNGKNIEQDFFEELSSRLDALKDGFFYLTGMFDDDTAELVLTAEGTIKNIIFVEELVMSAPEIQNWKFTALKPALDIENVRIDMSGYTFGSDSLFFYSNDHPDYPDEIDITVIHRDFKDEVKSIITNGTYIFIDNYLGELNSVTTIDNLRVIGKREAEKELIPIEKLKSFLIWREKEFLEKYEGKRYDTKNDSYSSLEAELQNGRPLIAIINTTLIDWDSKGSHPWILKIEIMYNGNNANGMPDKNTYELMAGFEEEIMNELKDFEGYLNIGRQTADNAREIYFACHDFRKPSKVLHELTKKYAGRLEIMYDIYKDKYWQSFERFRSN